MDNVTIRNKHGVEINVKEGACYYVETDSSLYGSGTIYIKQIDNNERQIAFQPITASVPNGCRHKQGFPIFDIGSNYSTWIMSEEPSMPNKIDLSFDDLMGVQREKEKQ